jgi:hypothetical protein
VEAFDMVAGEPALTLVPNLAASGALAILFSTALGVWCVTFGSRFRPGGFGIIGLSVGMLLVGAGFGPPLMGLILGGACLWWERRRSREPSPRAVLLAGWWRSLTAFGVLAYLSLVPGLVVLAHLGVTVPETVVPVLSLAAFTGLILSLIAASAADIAANDGRRPNAST